MTQLDEKLAQIESESLRGQPRFAGRVSGALLGVLFRLSWRRRRR